MPDAYIWIDPTTGKKYAVSGSAKVEIDPLVFDAMMETFEGDNNRLIAENTRLREVVADGHMHAREILAENAKLRELAKKACELARVFCDCGGTFNDLDDLLCEASELGVEVPV